MRSIIVEGPDGCGKSTVIAKLGLERLHTVAFKPEYGPPVPWYLNRVLKAKPTGFDRLHLSEWIYGPMLRAASAVNQTQMAYLTAEFRIARIPVIVCLTDYETSLRNVRSRPFPEYQTEEFLWNSYQSWRQLADSEWVDYVYEWHKPEYGGDRELRASKGLPMDLLQLI